MHVNCERLSVISIEPSNNNKIKKIQEFQNRAYFLTHVIFQFSKFGTNA